VVLLRDMTGRLAVRLWVDFHGRATVVLSRRDRRDFPVHQPRHISSVFWPWPYCGNQAQPQFDSLDAVSTGLTAVVLLRGRNSEHDREV
jgi:hypothetical protein